MAWPCYIENCTILIHVVLIHVAMRLNCNMEYKYPQISTDKTSLLGAKSRYMKKMLQLVKQKVDNNTIDITLKFTLSALWNLTGETRSPGYKTFFMLSSSEHEI